MNSKVGTYNKVWLSYENIAFINELKFLKSNNNEAIIQQIECITRQKKEAFSGFAEGVVRFLKCLTSAQKPEMQHPGPFAFSCHGIYRMIAKRF